MKISFGLSYYQDLAGLKRLFESITKLQINPYRIFAIDGRYAQFATDTDNILSSNEVHQYLEQFPRVVNYTSWTQAPTEIEKRNKYLELATDVDILIVIDTDEYLTGDWSIFTENLEKRIAEIETMPPIAQHLHYLKMEDCQYPLTSSLRHANRPRIFYRPYEFRYWGCHNIWKHITTGQNLVHSKLYPVIEGITIVHDDSLRENGYEKNMREYQEKQKYFEKNEYLLFDPAQQTKINPLVFIPSPRDIPEFLEAAAKITLPKYWVKYYWPEVLAYREARRFFLQEKQYTHFVILPDDLIITENDLFRLLSHFENPKRDIVSGYCNIDNTTLKDYANICLDYVTDVREKRVYKWLTLDEVARKRNLFKAKFSGFPLMVIKRNVIESIEFRNDSQDGTSPDGCCIDVTFCVDAHKNKYDIYVDPSVRLNHLKIKDGRYQNMGVKRNEPYTKLETSFITPLVQPKP